jgi:hypothetical protein
MTIEIPRGSPRLSKFDPFKGNFDSQYKVIVYGLNEKMYRRKLNP